jgi:transposase InsO family protein
MPNLDPERTQAQAGDPAAVDPPRRWPAPAPQQAHDHREQVGPLVPDLVRRFTATPVDTKWCGDITHISVGSSWLYLATVIDICSRRVVDWSIADHMRTELVTDAIEMAVRTRGGDVRGVCFRSDRGYQYTAVAFVDGYRRHGIRPSRGRVGSSYDNALADPSFQGLKRE